MAPSIVIVSRGIIMSPRGNTFLSDPTDQEEAPW